jgi:hypothetical protein
MRPKKDRQKPSNVMPRGEQSTAAAKSSAKPDTHSFKYSAFDDSFEIEVRFREGSGTGNASVLKALKEAFDAVKDGRTSA